MKPFNPDHDNLIIISRWEGQSIAGFQKNNSAGRRISEHFNRRCFCPIIIPIVTKHFQVASF